MAAPGSSIYGDRGGLGFGRGEEERERGGLGKVDGVLTDVEDERGWPKSTERRSLQKASGSGFQGPRHYGELPMTGRSGECATRDPGDPGCTCLV
jgi:hypothetical protein